MSMISELVEELIDNADLYTKELHDLMYEAADTIEMLSEKAREPKQEWIPCKERLPKAGVSVIVTSKGGYVYTSNIAHGEWEYGGDVIAWTPLPTAYEGEDDE